MSGLNFTAIDFETANSQRGSVCAVGIVQVRNGEITKAYEWHVKPPIGADSFDPRNVAIHGITSEMVSASNSWQESMEVIQMLAQDHPLVAYNAPFDKSVIREASRLSGVAPPLNDFYCALALARKYLSMDRYRLPLVAAELGVDPFDHHSAGSDAAACAQIVLELSKRHNLLEISDLWPSGVSVKSKSDLRASAYSRGNRSSIADLPQPNLKSDSSHPFYSRQVIMTGDLRSYSRWDAMEKIASVGGRNGKGVTKKTAFLLVGDGRTHSSIDLPNGTTKEQKVAAYIAAGQDIKILTELEFLRLIDADAHSVAPAALPEDSNTAIQEKLESHEPTRRSRDGEHPQDEGFSMRGPAVRGLESPHGSPKNEAAALPAQGASETVAPTARWATFIVGLLCAAIVIGAFAVAELSVAFIFIALALTLAWAGWRLGQRISRTK